MQTIGTGFEIERSVVHQDPTFRSHKHTYTYIVGKTRIRMVLWQPVSAELPICGNSMQIYVKYATSGTWLHSWRAIKHLPGDVPPALIT